MKAHYHLVWADMWEHPTKYYLVKGVKEAQVAFMHLKKFIGSVGGDNTKVFIEEAGEAVKYRQFDFMNLKWSWSPKDLERDRVIRILTNVGQTTMGNKIGLEK